MKDRLKFLVDQIFKTQTLLAQTVGIAQASLSEYARGVKVKN
jgi:hypothetical protein